MTLQAAAFAMLGTVMAQAQSVPQEKPTAPATPEASEEIVELSPFEVNSSKDTGYQATETLAGTRIRTELRDVGSAISVVTKEFMEDIGATDTSTLLQYTTNAEVAGTRGTYGGLGNGQTLYESANTIGTNNRVRGLSSVDNTRDFYSTSIPWDAYNVDRIDIQRGPNS
ncbi:MAG TPA: TonB-dependent receptor, partial [Candidatus Hydrogenedentes bacterium]|nr:TonB-dependent receptor [Candidatus Hydrogenedentota bacterium]